MPKDLQKDPVLGSVRFEIDTENPAVIEKLRGRKGDKGDSIKGDPGKSIKGDPGKDSDKPGPPGRAPTQEEVVQAVHKYLSGVDLRGKKGDPGGKGDSPTDEHLMKLIRRALAGLAR